MLSILEFPLTRNCSIILFSNSVWLQLLRVTFWQPLNNKKNQLSDYKKKLYILSFLYETLKTINLLKNGSDVVVNVVSICVVFCWGVQVDGKFDVSGNDDVVVGVVSSAVDVSNVIENDVSEEYENGAGVGGISVELSYFSNTWL